MITDIHLQSFRSYKDESFELSPGVNIIVGPNASGKTNLLEAILMVSRGKSYRAKDADLIRFEAPWAKLTAHTDANDTRAVLLENQGSLAHKTFKINDKPFKRLGLHQGLPTVIFEPNHLQIINGPPDTRRQYVDGILEQTKSGYSGTLRQYKRILAQRNTLLKKSHNAVAQQLFAWNIRLSELGEQIAKSRAQLITAIDTQAGDLYNELTNGQYQVKLTYQTTVNLDHYATELLQKLEASTDIDISRGFTSYGPHREDLVVLLDGRLATESASRGEARTLLLVFKILEVEVMEKASQIRPIILLDDVFSELDGNRRFALTKFLQNYQTFITTTDADIVVRHFTQNCSIIPLVPND